LAVDGAGQNGITIALVDDRREHTAAVSVANSGELMVIRETR